MDRADAGGPAVLGVERSVTARRWRLRQGDERAGMRLAQETGLPEIVCRVLAARGVGAGEVASFLDPRLRELLPDPAHLKDMNRAVDRLAGAVSANEPIAIFGDYDVDGATSSAVLARFLRAVAGRVSTYIPDRMREGYGPNAAALARLATAGNRVVVTVDCGTTAHEALRAGAASGLDTIVVDHHIAEPLLPPAYAVVNPNRLDEASPHRQLAAVGVTFLLAVALNRRLREAGWYAAREEPDLLGLVDLVALGTMCDVVPLTGVNRAFVAQGLKVLAARPNPGLKALSKVAGLTAPAEAYHLGFVLGPRVNAGGRVGEADLGARLLTTDDEMEAFALAERLNRHNQERQAIEAAVLESAIAQVEAAGTGATPAIIAAAPGWHPGVIGIVASRLRERYERPACVIALEGALGRGSGRSANGVDLGAAVIAARQAGLLVNGGGHANAAGFTVAEDKVAALREFLVDRIGRESAERALGPSLGIDAVVAVSGASVEAAQQLARLGPFGAGNAEPRLALSNARIVRADVVGAGHVRCQVSGPTGGRLGGIAFRSADTALGRLLLDRSGAPVHLAGRLRVDWWAGTPRVQLHVDDAAPAS